MMHKLLPLYLYHIDQMNEFSNHIQADKIAHRETSKFYLRWHRIHVEFLEILEKYIDSQSKEG